MEASNERQTTPEELFDLEVTKVMELSWNVTPAH